MASTVAFYLITRDAQFQDHQLLTLLSGLSQEAIGIYASVRVLEFLVRKNQERRESRIELIHNSRFLYTLAHAAAKDRTPFNIQHLQLEVDHTNEMFARRQDILTEDERIDLGNYYRELRSFIKTLRETAGVHADAFAPGLDTDLTTLDSYRWKAQLNVFEETPDY